MFDNVTSQNPLSQQFVNFVDQAKNEVSAERISNLINENLKLMQDDIITFGNAIVDMVNDGQFKELETDATWEMKSVSFTLRSKYGHFIVVTINAHHKHELFISQNNITIEAAELDIETVCDLVKNYNYLFVSTASGRNIIDINVNPLTFLEQNRENE